MCFNSTIQPWTSKFYEFSRCTLCTYILVWLYIINNSWFFGLKEIIIFDDIVFCLVFRSNDNTRNKINLILAVNSIRNTWIQYDCVVCKLFVLPFFLATTLKMESNDKRRIGYNVCEPENYFKITQMNYTLRVIFSGIKKMKNVLTYNRSVEFFTYSAHCWNSLGSELAF